MVQKMRYVFFSVFAGRLSGDVLCNISLFLIPYNSSLSISKPGLGLRYRSFKIITIFVMWWKLLWYKFGAVWTRMYQRLPAIC